MKFTVAWSEILSQNNTLKVFLASFTVISLVLCITVVRLATREPLLIERECRSRSLIPVKTTHTPEEIERFVKEIVSTRFDSEALDSKVYLGEEEYAYRLKEQEDLTRKGMKQRVFPSLVNVTDKEVLVEADRILVMGNLRSNVPFSLSVQVTAISRSAANPYGLIIQRVSQINKENSK